METITVLRYGAQVRLTNVDMNGYLGRDLHPTPEDVGFLGIVVGNVVSSSMSDGGELEVRLNVLGGTVLCPVEVVTPEGDEMFTDLCYIVQDASGRKLELMDHEIEAV